MYTQRLLLASLLLLVMAGCVAPPSALPATTPQVVATPISTLVPASTSTFVPLPAGMFTSEDMQRRVEQHPAEYKLAIDKDTAVLFAYPHPVGDWAGPIFIVHIPSVSEVVLDWDGKISFEHYGSDAGRKSIGQVLANTELVQRAQTRASEIWGRPTATPDVTPPSLGVSDDTANFVNPTFTELNKPGARGFVVEGTLGPGYGEGEYAKSAYIELDSHVVAFGCNLRLCASRFFDQILATLEIIP